MKKRLLALIGAVLIFCPINLAWSVTQYSIDGSNHTVDIFDSVAYKISGVNNSNGPRSFKSFTCWVSAAEKPTQPSFQFFMRSFNINTSSGSIVPNLAKLTDRIPFQYHFIGSLMTEGTDTGYVIFTNIADSAPVNIACGFDPTPNANHE